MTVFLCVACGTSYPAADYPPDRCAICEDERQFVPATGQAWISREALAETHRNAWTQMEPGLLSLQTVPAFAIGQRALLLMTPAGNVLWDCLALLDPATEALIRGLGGLAAIAISHPHFYTAMQDWAAAFEAPIHLHAADQDWAMRPSPWLRPWDGAVLEVLPGVTAVHVGGHFPGSTVLHWAAGAEGAGVLMVGDTVQVTPGARRVSFMWSYPNLMPLSAAAVRRLAAVLASWRYDRIYGAFAGTDVLHGAPAIVERSAARHVALLEERGQNPSEQER
jgi:glyoxylase-like metal-dependent hydrolase (beta-lactamase superfamily II)